MKFFLHTDSRIRLVTDENDFECSPERFSQLEPDYPGKPEGVVVRYWTKERAYFEGGGVIYDGHDCEQYCDRIASYTAYPLIYIRVILSNTTLNLKTPGESIAFTASLEDEHGHTLPIDHTWHVTLTHQEEGDIDCLELVFVQGVCVAVYQPQDSFPLGTWFLDHDTFETFELEGVTYQFRLVTPVQFVVYRSV